MFIWFLPFLYAYAQIINSNETILSFIKKFRSLPSGAVIVLILIVYGIYLGNLPAYNEMWKPGIRVEATFDEIHNKPGLNISGNEYFKDVHVSGDTTFSMIDTRTLQKNIPISFEADWFQIFGNEDRISGDKDTLQFDWSIIPEYPIVQTTLELKADTAEIEVLETNCLYNQSKEGIQYLWYGDRLDTISVNGKLVVAKNADLIRRIKVSYTRLPVNLKVESKLATVRYRTEVSRVDTLSNSTRSVADQITY
jgi:hypothetical protein